MKNNKLWLLSLLIGLVWYGDSKSKEQGSALASKSSANSWLSPFRDKNKACGIINTQEIQKIAKLNTKVKTRSNGSSESALCSYSWREESKSVVITLVLTAFDASTEIFPPKKLNEKELKNEALKTIALLKKQPGNQNLSIDSDEAKYITSALEAANQFEFISDIGDGVTQYEINNSIVLTAVVGNTRLKINGRTANAESIKNIAKHILERKQ